MNHEEALLRQELMRKVFLSNSTENCFNANHLDILGELNIILAIEDWRELIDNDVFIDVVLSPGSITYTKRPMPLNSSLISVDYNSLKHMKKEHVIAIILHEIGHALNKGKTGFDSELMADEYVLSKGYGNHLIDSIEQNIKDFPDRFDNDNNHLRIERAKNRLQELLKTNK